MEKGFFKVFISENSVKQLKIPTSFIDYKNEKFPQKVFLRDRFGNIWLIGVTKTARNFYFQVGWEKFIEDNNVELGDFMIFDYDGNGFDFKLLGRSECEKKGAGGLKLVVNMEEEGKMNVERQKSVALTEKNWASESNNNSSYDDSNEDYMIEKEEENEDKEFEVVKKEDEEKIEKAPHSKHRYMEEEEYDNDEDEEEDKNEMADKFKKNEPRSTVGCERATTYKVRECHDYFGTDIFKNGRATQPKNSYFVAKIRSYRRDEMYVPVDVLRDYKFELPSSMTIRDSAGREFETKLKIWKDGRIWLIGGWRSLYRWNLVDKNDKCICEFMREKYNKNLYLQVQVLHEGASSHSNKKNKK